MSTNQNISLIVGQMVTKQDNDFGYLDMAFGISNAGNNSTHCQYVLSNAKKTTNSTSNNADQNQVNL